MFKSVELNSLKETHHILYLLQSQKNGVPKTLFIKNLRVGIFLPTKQYYMKVVYRKIKTTLHLNDIFNEV